MALKYSAAASVKVECYIGATPLTDLPTEGVSELQRHQLKHWWLQIQRHTKQLKRLVRHRKCKPLAWRHSTRLALRGQLQLWVTSSDERRAMRSAPACKTNALTLHPLVWSRSKWRCAQVVLPSIHIRAVARTFCAHASAALPQSSNSSRLFRTTRYIYFP